MSGWFSGRPQEGARKAMLAGLAVALVALGACSTSTTTTTGSTSGSGAGSGTTTVGFIMVGSESDYGYNQAVYAGAQAVTKDMGSVKALFADNIPETNAVNQTMLQMVNAGARIIFATSYGYYPYALAFAKAHPDVYVFHQGGFDSDATIPPNFGTYWGQAFEPVSLGGMAAGALTKSNKLGFVYAFPISQTIDNIDAFELGAQSINPSATTLLVNTSAWCDTTKQKEAATALLSQGVDVLSQHQDCQTTVINAACQANASVVGYHYDAKSLCPKGWLTGSAWSWAPVYENIIKAVQGGSFATSAYHGNWVGTFAGNDNPLTLASFGTSVPAGVQARITAEETALKQAGTSVFKGPVYCQDGSLLVQPGVVPTYAQIDSFNCLVRGVVGTLPKS